MSMYRIALLIIQRIATNAVFRCLAVWSPPPGKLHWHVRSDSQAYTAAAFLRQTSHPQSHRCAPSCPIQRLIRAWLLNPSIVRNSVFAPQRLCESLRYPKPVFHDISKVQYSQVQRFCASERAESEFRILSEFLAWIASAPRTS